MSRGRARGRPSRRVAPILAVALVTLGLGGCGWVSLMAEKPEVQSVSVTVVRVDFRKAELRFDVTVNNAGSGSATVSGYDYDLQVEGQPFLAGKLDTGFELKPHAVTVIPVPVSIKFADLFKKAAHLLGRSEAAYRVIVGLQIKTSVGTFRLPFQKDGRVALPAIPKF